MSRRFAAATSVSVEKSQQEVQGILRRYGAEKFGVMEDRASAYLMFQFKHLMIQMQVPLPKREEFEKSDGGRVRKGAQVDDAHSQAIKQRWRALVLAVKAKLEAVETGISTIEKEFLAFVVMPDGTQLGDKLIPELEIMGKTGKMPKFISWTGGKNE